MSRLDSLYGIRQIFFLTSELAEENMPYSISTFSGLTFEQGEKPRIFDAKKQIGGRQRMVSYHIDIE